MQLQIDTSVQSPNRANRPGWSEMIVGLIAYVFAFGVVFLILKMIPDDLSELGGVIQLALSGIMGLAAFAAAFAIKRRGLAAFGLQKASWKSLLLGAGLGVVCWILGAIVSLITYSINGGIENVQGDYQAAAAGGVLAVIGTVIMGSILTPLGEELFFRGVLTSGLLRFGPWIGIVVSAAIFALAYGINPVLPVAFIVGVINGILFHRTGSVWPGVVSHAFNNACAAFVPVVLAVSLG